MPGGGGCGSVRSGARRGLWAGRECVRLSFKFDEEGGCCAGDVRARAGAAHTRRRPRAGPRPGSPPSSAFHSLPFPPLPFPSSFTPFPLPLPSPFPCIFFPFQKYTSSLFPSSSPYIFHILSIPPFPRSLYICRLELARSLNEIYF